MLRSFATAIACSAVLLATGCVPTSVYVEPGAPCSTKNYTVDDDFDGARRGRCRARTDDLVELTIAPENVPINDSAWYAFRLTPNKPGVARIRLRYQDGHHRYWPKLSLDGDTWQPVPVQALAIHAGCECELLIRLELDERPVWVAAQELLTPARFDPWVRGFAERNSLGLEALGNSRAGRPIHALRFNPDARETVLFVGRQHPPEVTGVYGLQGFVETVFADTPLAHKFRDRFGVVIVPMLNPDGVVAGNWRHNLGGKDLNRDWGPFEEPETQRVAALLDQMDANGQRLRLFLDFHSTKRNVFYTQSDDDVTRPPGFADRWLNAARPGLDGYPFEIAKRHNTDLTTSKNYMYSRYGIPAITYEVDDRTERETALAAAAIFAREMMQIMVDTDVD